MNFSMNGDLVDLVDSVGDFLERRDDARAVAEAAGRHPAAQRSRWTALCELGLPALALPEPDGVGAGLLEATAVAERLGAALLPEPATETMVLARACSEVPASADLTRQLCSGAATIEFFGWDTVMLAGDGRVDGSARILGDGLGERVAFLADGPSGGEAAIVICDRATLHPTGPRIDVDPTRPWIAVDLTGVEPTRVVRIGNYRMARVRSELVILALAGLVGGMQRVLDDTVAYVGEREQFGRALGSFQAIKHQLADIYVATEQARAAAQFAAIACADGTDTAAGAVASTARWIPRSAIEVCEKAIHLHGAMGYSWELPMHLQLRRALCVRELLTRPIGKRAM